MLSRLTPAGVITMGALLPALDIILVALRLYAKHKVRRHGIDDWLIIVSLILTMGLGVILIYGSVVDGFGRASPSNDAGFEEDDSILISTKKLTVCFDYIQMWAFGTAKLSVIFFYRSIFCGRAFNIASWSMVCIVIAWILGSFFAVAFQCGTKFSYLWTSAANVASHCTSGAAVGIGFSIPDVVTDGLILAMPLYWTWQLQMSFWKKVSVCGIFLFGAITIVASIIRLIVYVIVYPNHNKKSNQVGVYSTIVYWSMLEMGLSIIAACLPTLAPIFRDLSAEKLSQRVHSFLIWRSQSAGVIKSVSQTNILRNIGAENNVGLETIAMGNFESGHAEGGGLQGEIDGQILVTKGLRRHSSSVDPV